MFFSKYCNLPGKTLQLHCNQYGDGFLISRLTHGSKALSGKNCTKCQLLLYLRSKMNWTLKILRNLKRYLIYLYVYGYRRVYYSFVVTNILLSLFYWCVGGQTN